MKIYIKFKILNILKYLGIFDIMQNFVFEKENDDIELSNKIIEERNLEIKSIYEEMQEINRLFKVINDHIFAQGEGIDNIGSNIESAEDNCRAGLNSIKEAEKEQSSNNKLYMYIGLGIGGAATIGAAIIGSVFLL